MKINILNQNSEGQEPEMNLYLEEDGGEIRLRGTDARGYNWIIGTFYPDGLCMAGCINKELSDWPVNHAGELIVYGGKDE